MWITKSAVALKREKKIKIYKHDVTLSEHNSWCCIVMVYHTIATFTTVVGNISFFFRVYFSLDFVQMR